MSQHNHVLSSGWINSNKLFRECMYCRKVFAWDCKVIHPKSDYTYYKQMAEYYEIR
jgi:hypothetical protein